MITQSHEILSLPDNALKTIELAARTCYKSEDKIEEGSDKKIVQLLVDKGHHAMLEFGWIIVKCITNRGITHELVRHRLASFAQESTRYVGYGEGAEFIEPIWWNDERITDSSRTLFQVSNEIALQNYIGLRKEGWRAEEAREVLPNSLKAEIVIGANLREWRHIFSMRCQSAAHPQMRALMRPILREVSDAVPIIFDDLRAKFLPNG